MKEKNKSVNNLPPILHDFISQKKSSLGKQLSNKNLQGVIVYYLLRSEKFKKDFEAFLEYEGIKKDILSALEYSEDK